MTYFEEVLNTVTRLLHKGKKIQLELDKNGNVKLLEINTRVILRKENN